MKSFRRFALFTTLATYFLIFMGGLVRVSGAGLGCPDWPKCFGRWIPPTNVEQLPPNIDPAQFNFVLAWIEYVNRLTGVIVGLLIAATAVWAISSFRRQPRIVLPAVAAAVLTAFQGWQGSVVISSQLEPVVVTVHMALALIIVSLLIYLTQEAYYRENREAFLTLRAPRGVIFSLGMLWVIAIIQIALGTQIRSALEILARKFPLSTSAEWIGKVGLLNHIHTVLGVLLVAFSWGVAFSIWKYRDRISPLMRQSVVAMVTLATLQLFMGLTFIALDLTPIVQVFHLWLASLYVGSALLLYTIFRKREAAS